MTILRLRLTMVKMIAGNNSHFRAKAMQTILICHFLYSRDIKGRKMKEKKNENNSCVESYGSYMPVRDSYVPNMQ